MHGRLVLFDIDGTLLDTKGAGMDALRLTVRELFDRESPELDLGGATDSGLARDILESFGEALNEENLGAFYGTYLGYLEAHLGAARYAGEVLPGVEPLLERLVDAGATLGLLTGNIAHGAALKVRHFGLSGYFDFGAYGDDHHDRNKLGPIALQRAREARGMPFEASETVVVGDTPKDVACGKALGAVTLCVATGGFSADDLRACGGDLVVENFADAGVVVDRLRSRVANRG